MDMFTSYGQNKITDVLMILAWLWAFNPYHPHDASKHHFASFEHFHETVLITATFICHSIQLIYNGKFMLERVNKSISGATR